MLASITELGEFLHCASDVGRHEGTGTLVGVTGLDEEQMQVAGVALHVESRRA